MKPLYIISPIATVLMFMLGVWCYKHEKFGLLIVCVLLWLVYALYLV